MPSRIAQNYAFPVVLFLSLIAALVPVRWQPAWIGELGEFVRFPLRPFTEGGTMLAQWLRPAPQGPLNQSDTDIEALRRDREAAIQLYHSEHQRVLELERKLQELRSIPQETLARARTVVAAYITARTPGSTEGAVEVRVDSSFRGVIHDHTIGVSGADLLGRTLASGAAGTALILPITHVATGPLQAMVFPADDALRPNEDAVAVHLEPNETGQFIGDVNRDDFVEVGDVVRLDDSSWPATAQSMVIGTVTDVRPKDSEPLRHTITVEPRTRMSQISELELVLMDDLATAQAGPRGEDQP